MIDQVDEVGQYAFQIRLFDEGKSSRLTLPPISDGLNICEPIAIESGEDVVGEAGVGYSRVTYGETTGAFDEEGNYNETIWENGDLITEGKLNKIEEALDVINDKVKGIDLSDYAVKDYVAEEISKIELLPGPQGEPGKDGEKGDKGDTGEKGADGLTTSIKVNGTTYTQANGLITLPNYPKETDLTDYATKEYVADEISGALQYTLQSEEWTFELADGTTVTKKVVIK